MHAISWYIMCNCCVNLSSMCCTIFLKFNTNSGCLSKPISLMKLWYCGGNPRIYRQGHAWLEISCRSKCPRASATKSYPLVTVVLNILLEKKKIKEIPLPGYTSSSSFSKQMNKQKPSFSFHDRPLQTVSLVALRLSVGYETWPLIGGITLLRLTDLIIGWDCLSKGSTDRNFHRFSEAIHSC